MTNNVAVIGVGQTKFGELWDKSLRDLSVEDRALAGLFLGSYPIEF